jgi:hypothetical protein
MLRVACVVALLAGGTAGVVRLGDGAERPAGRAAAALVERRAALAGERVRGEIMGACRESGEYRMNEVLFCARYAAVAAGVNRPTHPYSQCEACVVQCADPGKPYQACLSACRQACALF